ncbi:MAG: hydroxymethylglutaryl-CoA lyase [Chitinophagaceae bacterium]|nr:hydroxymethylglutaryl-CoA lyase [Chitinophagaceae bacterium]
MQKPDIELVECPRDAMQGWPRHIPAAQKIRYLNALLKAGFHTLDFGSFVSPKAIPQMADTHEVLNALEPDSATSLLAIVANQRGAEDAAAYDRIDYLGFPFSISPTFQQRNTNSSQQESMERIEAIQELCLKTDKTLVVYLSMGFGNPYNDPYDAGILLQWADELAQRDVKILSLADTVGLATPQQISFALETLIPQYPAIRFGVHLHSSAASWEPKLAAAYQAGCRRFDGALKGIGGCPMAQDDLVGNMDSELMIGWFEKRGVHTGIDQAAMALCSQLANEIFA